MPIQWKPLTDVCPGERLADDLKGPAGETLLKADAELSERTIAMLAQRDVDTVPVRVAVDPQLLAQEEKRIDELLERRFRHCANEPLMLELREITRRVMLVNAGCDQ